MRTQSLIGNEGQNMKRATQAHYLGLVAVACFFFANSLAHADNIFVSNYDNRNNGGYLYEFDSAGNESNFAPGFTSAAGLAFDNSGNLYVANIGGTIDKFDTNGNMSVFASGLGAPRSLACDSSGNVYVACVSSNTVEKFDSSGNGVLFASGLYDALACDSNGNLWGATIGAVYKFDSSGNRTLFATSGVHLPLGLAFDSAGNLYAANSSTGTIEKFDSSGNGTVFASGISVYGLAFDSSDNLYVATYGGNAIVEFDSNGHESLLATLDHPQDIAVQITPEPATCVLVALGVIGLLASRRLRRQP